MEFDIDLFRRDIGKAYKKAVLTTRGTPRQRWHKGEGAALRYYLLQKASPDVVEDIFQKKLKRMSARNREAIQRNLEPLVGEDRYEFIMRTLAEMRRSG